MKSKTEELLYFLLWSAEMLVRPTFRNVSEGYEAWAYRKGLLRQAQTLERRNLIERHPQDRSQRLYRLTEAGRLQALGGRDPETQWSRSWDGRWRLVVFDIPIKQNGRRDKLRRYLRSRTSSPGL
jgi:DNA-binding transcriptional regulator PaaX